MPAARIAAGSTLAALILTAVGMLAGSPASARPAAPSPPTTPMTAAPAVRTVRYTVKAGDNLSAIARGYGIAPTTLARANGMRLTGLLLPGRTLTVSIPLPPGLPARLPAPLLALPDRLALFPLFVTAATEFNVPADLLMATAYIESGWKAAAVSPTGAIGVGQIHPETAQWISIVLLHQPPLDPSVAKDNIRMSARFLRFLLDTTPSTTRALAAYFQGPGATARTGITPVGLAYASRILAVRPSFS
jgi:soluble lytic murein transglycosylase-like protein